MRQIPPDAGDDHYSHPVPNNGHNHAGLYGTGLFDAGIRRSGGYGPCCNASRPVSCTGTAAQKQGQDALLVLVAFSSFSLPSLCPFVVREGEGADLAGRAFPVKGKALLVYLWTDIDNNRRLYFNKGCIAYTTKEW